MSSGKRKEEHLHISLNEPVNFQDVTTGFEDYYFIHQALPEINLEDIDLSIELFGKRLKAPILISPMVGGIPGQLLLTVIWRKLPRIWG